MENTQKCPRNIFKTVGNLETFSKSNYIRFHTVISFDRLPLKLLNFGTRRQINFESTYLRRQTELGLHIHTQSGRSEWYGWAVAK